jgi:hypothetical protein
MKEQFIEKAINVINDRTVGGTSISGKSFKRYSKEYAKEKGSTHVNLLLDGDMLNATDGEDISRDKVKLFVGGDTVQTLKSFNHNVGDTLPRRTYFGLQTQEAKAIVEEIEGGE